MPFFHWTTTPCALQTATRSSFSDTRQDNRKTPKNQRAFALRQSSPRKRDANRRWCCAPAHPEWRSRIQRLTMNDIDKLVEMEYVGTNETYICPLALRSPLTRRQFAFTAQSKLRVDSSLVTPRLATSKKSSASLVGYPCSLAAPGADTEARAPQDVVAESPVAVVASKRDAANQIALPSSSGCSQSPSTELSIR